MSSFLVKCLFAVLVLGALRCPAQTPREAHDAAILSELSTRFYQAFERNDIDGQLALWSPKATQPAAKREEVMPLFSALDRLRIAQLSIDKVQIRGDRASVRMKVRIEAFWKGSDKPVQVQGPAGPLWELFNRDARITNNFINENGRWLLFEQFGTAETLAAEIAEAPTIAEQSALLEKYKGLADPMMILNIQLAAERLFNDSDYEQAVAVDRIALRLSEQIGDKTMIRQSLEFLANHSVAFGDYPLQLQYYQRVLQITQELGDARYTSNIFNTIGTIYADLGDRAQAFHHFRKSVEMINPAPGNFRWSNLGRAYLEAGDYRRAGEIFGRGIEDLRAQLAAETDSGKKEEINQGIAGFLIGSGDIKRAAKDYSAALGLYLEALRIYQNLKRKIYLGYILNKIAETHHLLGNYSEALRYAQLAAAAPQRPGPRSISALVTSGRAYLALGQAEPAFQIFNKAIAEIEEMRNYNFGSEISQQRYFERWISPYQEMIELLIGQGRYREALGFVERARARVLLEVLARGRLQITKSMTADERLQERRLTARLYNLNQLLTNEQQRSEMDDKKIAELETQLEKARREHETFRDILYAAYPNLKSQRGQSQPLGADEAMKMVTDEKTALLEFFVSAGQTFLFVITRDAGRAQPRLEVYPVTIDQQQLSDKIERFRQMIENGELDFGPASRELYDLLVKPAEAQLAGKTVLTIIPDSILWNVPFQALKSPRQRFLVEDCAISYAPSLSVLKEITKTGKTRPFPAARPPALLAFGNPNVNSPTEARQKAVLMGERLDPLPEAERQVRELAKLYGAQRSRIYTGTQAREEVFKKEAHSFRILQFATHGIFDTRNPMYSHLVFSQTGQKSDEDGLLEAWEVADLELNADLAVLAACETARGKIGDGEGIIGISWAFFIAGVPTTVASQWKVESSSTTELMLEFHRQLLAGKAISRAEALRRASLKLMNTQNYRHPSYWAGFVMIGNGN